MLSQTDDIASADIDATLKLNTMLWRSSLLMMSWENHDLHEKGDLDEWDALRTREIKKWILAIDYSKSRLNQEFASIDPPKMEIPKEGLVLQAVPTGEEYERYKQAMKRYSERYHTKEGLQNFNKKAGSELVRLLNIYYDKPPFNLPEFSKILKELAEQDVIEKSELVTIQNRMYSKVASIIEGVAKDPFPQENRTPK